MYQICGTERLKVFIYYNYHENNSMEEKMDNVNKSLSLVN